MSDIAGALDRTARRYRDCDRFTRHYVAAKLRMDPVHADVLALAARAPFGRVIDFGCGYGQLGVALLEAELADDVLGLDCRGDAVTQANRAAAGLRFRAEACDLASPGGIAAANTVLLIDVLYQLDPAVQAAVLRHAAGLARRRILIRTADPARRTRFRLGRAAERAFRRVWPSSGAHVQAPDIGGVLAALRRERFIATVASCSRGTPFANLLIVGERDG